MKRMKHLAAIGMFALAVLLPVCASGQDLIYVMDDFENKWNTGDYGWDMKSSSTNYYNFSDGYSMWSAWLYEPTGSWFRTAITDKVIGLYKLQSKPFNVIDSENLYCSMQFWYACDETDAERNFGVRIGKDDQWDTIYMLRENDSVLEAAPWKGSYGKEYSVDTNLGNKYNGQTDLVLQIFFYNGPSATSSFVAAVDNVLLASFTEAPAMKGRPTYNFDTYFGESGEFRFFARNLNCCNKLKGTMKCAYSISGSTPEFTDAVILDSIYPQADEAECYAEFNMKNLSIGEKYTLKFWPVEYDGQSFVYVDTFSWDFTYADAEKCTQDYVPLMESFTSATCSPCATMNYYLNPVLTELKDAGKINVVKYQMNYPSSGDSYYIAFNGVRFSYYDLSSVPTPYYNGESDVKYWRGSTYDDVMNRLKENASRAHEKKALAAVNIKKAHVDADKKFQVELDVTTAMDATLTVHAVVVEKTTTGNRGSNGERKFHWVTMEKATGYNGAKETFTAGEVKSLTYSVSMGKANVEEWSDLEVVCFIQNDNDQRIYQSASADVTSDVVGNENSALAKQVKMYPNPATEQVTFTGLDCATVTIFDLAGRKVYESGLVSDRLCVETLGFNTGLYLVRISQNGITDTRKLMVK